MKAFHHPSHSVYVLKEFIIEGSAFRPSILWIVRKKEDKPLKARVLSRMTRWQFKITPCRNRYNRCFILIRTPFFRIEKNNTGVEIGGWRYYFWFVELGMVWRQFKNRWFAPSCANISL